MDRDIKITYTVITVLVVFLAGLALFLQGNRDLPQVQVNSQSTTTETVGEIKIKPQIQSVKYTKEKTVSKTSTATTTTMQLPEKITSATITTNKGVIEIEFNPNTPETVKNFAKLALDNFYDGTRFHRVIRDFMIQGGDPLSKDELQKNSWGTGGPGYSFSDETSPNDVFNQGVLAMANSGPNTNGSQFFIVTAVAGTPWLAGKHTIFGHVTKGLDTVLKIGDMQTDGMDRPLQDVIVEKIVIN